MLKSFLAKEVKVYRAVFLFFPLLGAVYCYLSFHAPMYSLLHTAHYPPHWASSAMSWLMTPGAILLHYVIGLFHLCAFPVPADNLTISILFVMCQALIGLLLAVCVKCVSPRKKKPSPPEPTGEGEQASSIEGGGHYN